MGTAVQSAAAIQPMICRALPGNGQKKPDGAIFAYPASNSLDRLKPALRVLCFSW
jgi:hypothetical protein